MECAVIETMCVDEAVRSREVGALDLRVPAGLRLVRIPVVCMPLNLRLSTTEVLSMFTALVSGGSTDARASHCILEHFSLAA